MAAGIGAVADRHGHRFAGSLARGRAALRARGAGHGRDWRLVVAAGRRAAVRGQTAVVLLADRDGVGADAFVARRVPAAIVPGGVRLRRAGLRPRAALVESRDRIRGRAGTVVHGAIRVAGAAGADRCDAVFLDDAQLVRVAAPPAAGPVMALVHDRLGRGGTRRDHERREISAAARLDSVRDPAQREMAAAQGIGWRCALASRPTRVPCGRQHLARADARRQQRSVARCHRDDLFTRPSSATATPGTIASRSGTSSST